MESDYEIRNTPFGKIAGLLLIIGSIQFMLGVFIGETLYPGYNTAKNTLSDLAGSFPPVDITAYVLFNSVAIILGLCLLIAAYLLYKQFEDRIFSICLAIFGFGVVGVGIFPGHTGWPHVVFSLTSFIFGSISTILMYRILKNTVLKYVVLVLGLIAFLDILMVILLGDLNPFMIFGVGGAERLIAYPILFSFIMTGGYLTGPLSQ